MKKVMDLRNGPEYVIRELLMPHLRNSYDDVTTACAGADLLVSHPLTFAAPLVAEVMGQHGLAWASVGIAPSVFLSAFDPPVFAPFPGLIRLRILGAGFYGKLLENVKNSTRSWVEPWYQIRAQLRLPSTTKNPMFDGQFSSQLVLAMFSSALAKPQPDWPANTVQTGFPLYDGSADDEKLDSELSAFLTQGDPPIIFTLGSAAVMDAGDYYSESINAAKQLGKRALLLIGSDPRNLPGELPEGVAAFQYAPYSKVFPHGVAIVHQGGIGTTAQALRAGRPMLSNGC